MKNKDLSKLRFGSCERKISYY